jgi:hypothetical protein
MANRFLLAYNSPRSAVPYRRIHFNSANSCHESTAANPRAFGHAMPQKIATRQIRGIAQTLLETDWILCSKPLTFDSMTPPSPLEPKTALADPGHGARW